MILPWASFLAGAASLLHMHAFDRRNLSPRAVFVAAFAVVLMAAEWILLVAGTKFHEMIVGSAAVAVSAVFLFAVHKNSPLNLQLRMADLAACWRIPWYVVTGVYEITVILLKDLFGIDKAKSLYRVSGFKTSKDDPILVARRVLAITYTTAAPNFIVIGIDYTQSRMLFHQLERSSVPRMTKALGAQS